MCGGLRWGFLHVFSFCLSASIAYDRIAVARIRFPFLPKLVIIRNMVLMRGTDVTFHSTSSNGSSSGNAKNTAIWTETGVEWYCSQSYQPSAASQMNAEGVVYNYLAIG